VVIRQPFLEAPVLHAPFTEQEIEVVQAAGVCLLEMLWIVLRGIGGNDDANGCGKRASRGENEVEAIHLTLPLWPV
jgi:hypothetical protein